MRALLLSEYQNLNVVEVEKPVLGPCDILVSVKACGICGSDVHGYDGSSGRRIPPLVMGHEAAGTVTEVGAEVSRFSIGQRVTFDSMISCGKCQLCSKGSTNLCADRRVLASHAKRIVSQDVLLSLFRFRNTSSTRYLMIFPLNTRLLWSRFRWRFMRLVCSIFHRVRLRW